MITKDELRRAIAKLPEEYKRFTPFPEEWELTPAQMIELVDEGVIGMDGFRYQFREYAAQCWKVCHPWLL